MSVEQKSKFQVAAPPSKSGVGNLFTIMGHIIESCMGWVNPCGLLVPSMRAGGGCTWCRAGVG